MIETDRLYLRLQEYTDINHLIEMGSDPEVIRYTGDSAIYTISEARELLETRVFSQWSKYRMGRFAVTLKNGNFLGWCGLRYTPENGEVDLGYRFIKKYWGLGYGTEASQAILCYGFETLRLKLIVAKAMPENTNSIKILQKLKMTFRGYVLSPTDTQPFVLFEMTDSQWKTCAI